MTYRFIKALWCLSTTRQATRYLKTMLKILVDRAVMHHISFLSEWYLLWRSIDSRVVFRVTISNLNNLFPDFHSICYVLWLKRQLRFCGIWFWPHTVQYKKVCLFAVQQINCKVSFCWGFFAYGFFKNEEQPSEKITGQCFSTEMKVVCKNSATLEQETKTTKIVTYSIPFFH